MVEQTMHVCNKIAATAATAVAVADLGLPLQSGESEENGGTKTGENRQSQKDDDVIEEKKIIPCVQLPLGISRTGKRVLRIHDSCSDGENVMPKSRTSCTLLRKNRIDCGSPVIRALRPPYSPQVSSSFGAVSGLSASFRMETPVMKKKRESPVRPFIIGVCGGTASGKTTVCDVLRESLKNERVCFIPSDAFYLDLNSENRAKAHRQEYDFDHPNAIDWIALKNCVKNLVSNRASSLPMYDFREHARVPGKEQFLAPADVVIIEGILIYAADPELVDLMDLKIFVDCCADTRLARRLVRDISERGRDVSGVLEQYMKFVKPSYENFVEPSKRRANIIIPNMGSEFNWVAVQVLIQQIKNELKLRRKEPDEKGILCR